MITKKAYAKINLALFITDKLPNGYHTLETIFAPINWYDELSLELSDKLLMTCNRPDIPTDVSNLCMKAAKYLKQISGTHFGIIIHLNKKIPHGAGLGGGSSDAATVLVELNKIWNLNYSVDELAKIGVKLGADVPYFVKIKSLAHASGIGDNLTDLNVAFPFSIVTSFPNELVSTAWAYRNLGLQFPRSSPDLKYLIDKLISKKNLDLLHQFKNDFESTVLASFPNVRLLKEKFYESGADFAMMSGSGSAVFAVFENSNKAEECFNKISKVYPSSFTPSNFIMTSS